MRLPDVISMLACVQKFAEHQASKAHLAQSVYGLELARAQSRAEDTRRKLATEAQEREGTRAVLCRQYLASLSPDTAALMARARQGDIVKVTCAR